MQTSVLGGMVEYWKKALPSTDIQPLEISGAEIGFISE